MREVLGVREGYLDLHVLDSTDPAAVLAVEAAVDLETTLFVVSSKSGGTTETASFHAYFYERLKELDGDHAGHHFVAITDEGTSLQQEALDQGFRAVFVNPVGHRRPLLRAQLLRHGAGRADRRRPRAAARRRARHGRRVRPGRPGRARTPPCGSAPCWARPRWPAATS